MAPHRVISTVDPEARHTRRSRSSRRDWFRGHVAAEPETGLVTECEMTVVAGQGSSDADNGVTMACRDRFADDGPQADGLEIYGSSEHRTGDARAEYRDAGHRTVIKPGPLPAVPGGFTIDDFTVDEQASTVTCPAGVTRMITDRRNVVFGAACAGCPLRDRCTTAKDGRSMSIHPHEGLLRVPAPRPAPPNSRSPTHPVGDRADHRLDHQPRRAPAPLRRHRKERRLAAQPVRGDQPPHPVPPRTHPFRGSAGPDPPGPG